MKPLVLIATLLVFGCSPGSAQEPSCPNRLEDARGNSEGQPRLVLLETDPWAMVIGSDSPRLALYGDGRLIYRTDEGYKSLSLSEEEAAQLQGSLNLDALACFVGSHEGADMTDQPTQHLFFGRGGRLALISVYGDLDLAPVRSEVPSEVVSAYDKLAAFDHPDARPWLPELIEVMIWPYEYAPDPSIVWPKKWPSFDSPGALKRGDSYSIFIPASEYSELVQFLKGQRPKGAVEIGGKKWAASIRFPFPEEASWMSASN